MTIKILSIICLINWVLHFIYGIVCAIINRPVDATLYICAVTVCILTSLMFLLK